MSLDECANLLLQRDPDRLSALLTAPQSARPRLLTLYALATELARAPRASAEPALAEIRLQWWIDALQRLPASAGLHPVLQALSDAWGAEGKTLAALGEGHRLACEAGDFFDFNEALAWIDSTDGELAVMGARVLGVPTGAEAGVRAQGHALGIASYLRHGGPRGLPEAARDDLLAAGQMAARTASNYGVPRNAAPVLAAGPGLRAALDGDPNRPVSEFSRRWAALLLALTGRWKISPRR